MSIVHPSAGGCFGYVLSLLTYTCGGRVRIEPSPVRHLAVGNNFYCRGNILPLVKHKGEGHPFESSPVGSWRRVHLVTPVSHDIRNVAMSGLQQGNISAALILGNISATTVGVRSVKSRLAPDASL